MIKSGNFLVLVILVSITLLVDISGFKITTDKITINLYENLVKTLFHTDSGSIFYSEKNNQEEVFYNPLTPGYLYLHSTKAQSAGPYDYAVFQGYLIGMVDKVEGNKTIIKTIYHSNFNALAQVDDELINVYGFSGVALATKSKELAIGDRVTWLVDVSEPNLTGLSLGRIISKDNQEYKITLPFELNSISYLEFIANEK